MSLCKIIWNNLQVGEWQEKFNLINKSNILQTYEYAKANCLVNKQKARWGVIYIDDNEAGLVQIIEAGIIKNLIHGVIIDRGPLWFDGYGSVEDIKSFVKCLNSEFPARFGRKRRFIPEFIYSQEIVSIMEENGFKKNHNIKNYQTIWIDLEKSEEELRLGLKSNWRNKLKRAESYDLEIIWDSKGELLPFLLERYNEDRLKKQYENISIYSLREMVKYLIPKKELHIYKVQKDGKDMAAGLIFTHGTSATHQIGWVSDKARKIAANNFALWQTMLYLKNKGIKYYDLGGVNDEGAANIKKFKEGMGGDLIELCGLYS